jgi:hypothetical protein
VKSSAIYLLHLQGLKAVLYSLHPGNGVTSVSFTRSVAIKQTRRHVSEDLNLHQYLSGSLKFGSVCFLSLKLFQVENLQPLLSSKLMHRCILCIYLLTFTYTCSQNTTNNRWYLYVICITVQYTRTCFGLVNGPSSGY